MTFSSVAFLFVFLRCFSRIFFVGRLFTEDILSLVALVCSFGVSGAIEAGMLVLSKRQSQYANCPEQQHGLGRDFRTLSPDQTVPFFKVRCSSYCHVRLTERGSLCGLV